MEREIGEAAQTRECLTHRISRCLPGDVGTGLSRPHRGPEPGLTEPQLLLSGSHHCERHAGGEVIVLGLLRDGTVVSQTGPHTGLQGLWRPPPIFLPCACLQTCEGQSVALGSQMRLVISALGATT